MEKLCEEQNLIYSFEKDNYPITFTISPAPKNKNQMSMLPDDERDSSPAASMTWTFVNGDFEIETHNGSFAINKTLRTKIESILTKMISCWQQYFSYDVMMRNGAGD